jgi:hypothetical protein
VVAPTILAQDRESRSVQPDRRISFLESIDMKAANQPEVLPPEPRELVPRVQAGQRLFADENLELLSHLLDDWFRVPGTQIRFGLDGIVGLIPGLGDVIAGLASCIILVGAWFRGVPYIGLARMVVNLGIEVVVGAIPFIGDAFDIAWKANRRNYKLMVRHLEQPRRHTWKDWLFLIVLVVGTMAVFVSPVIVIVWLADWLLRGGR